MTLKDYIKTPANNIPTLASSLGVSDHAVRKWVYGQRTPSLEMALKIVAVTGGKVALASLIKENAR